MRKTLLATALAGAAALAFAGDGAGQTVTVTFYSTMPDSNETKLLKQGVGLGARFGHSFNSLIEWDAGLIATRHDLRWNQSLDNLYTAATTDLKFNFHPWDRPRSNLYIAMGIGYNSQKSDACFWGTGAPYWVSSTGADYAGGMLASSDVKGKTSGCARGGGSDAVDEESGFLWEWAAGANIGLNDHWAINIDIRQHHYNTMSRTLREQSNWVYERFYGAGVSYGWGFGPPKDTDGDGVSDGKDKCPDTPAGARVDAKGCPTDEDGDKVFDGLDACPGTPAGAKVDGRGCELDDDGDGVVNSADKCPNTPRGAKVDASGCPMDSDKDGVFDGLDRCPGTPAGTKVDAAGCPVDADDDGDGVANSKDRCPGSARGSVVDPTGCAKAVAGESIATLSGTDLRFASGSAVIPKAAYPKLDEFAGKVSEWLKNHPGAKMEVAGHTDSVGKKAFNQTLSQRRAAAVMNYLAKKGVPAASMSAKGYGPDRPIGENKTPEGRANNRRVEVTAAN